MKRTITVLISFALLMTVAVPAALASPARVLTKPTIDRFIKDFPAMQVEFEALGDKTMESIESLGSDEESVEYSAESLRKALNTAMADVKIKAILKRYGWNDTFVDVYLAIVSSCSYLAFEEVYNAYPMPEYKQYLDQVRATVHPDDIAIVKANKVAIDRVLNAVD